MKRGLHGIDRAHAAQHDQRRCKPDRHHQRQQQKQKEQEAQEDRDDHAVEGDTGLRAVDSAGEHAENRDPEDRDHHADDDEADQHGEAGVDHTDDHQWSGALAEARKKMRYGQWIAPIHRPAAQHQAADKDGCQDVACQDKQLTDKGNESDKCEQANQADQDERNQQPHANARREQSPALHPPRRTTTRVHRSRLERLAPRQGRPCAGCGGFVRHL